MLNQVFAPKRERRTSARHLCELRSQCRPLVDADDIDWPASIRDISRGGLKLAASRRFEPGTVLTILPRLNAKDAPRALVAKVVRVSRDGAAWTLGCCFARELASPEVGAFLE